MAAPRLNQSINRLDSPRHLCGSPAAAHGTRTARKVRHLGAELLHLLCELRDKDSVRRRLALEAVPHALAVARVHLQP